MEVLPLILAAVANMAIGFFWYSPMAFGELWMKYTGIKMPKKQTPEMKREMMRSMTLGLISSLVMAWVMMHFFGFVGVSNPAEGAETAFWLWLGFVAVVLFGDVLWTGKKLPHFAIDAGFRLVGMLAMGLILAIM